MAALNWPGLLPVLVLIWIAIPVFEVVRALIKTKHFTAPRRLYIAWRCLSESAWLSLFVIAADAYLQQLISLLTLVLTLVLAFAALAAAGWMVRRRLRIAQEEESLVTVPLA
jgi:hypothetical protein